MLVTAAVKIWQHRLASGAQAAWVHIVVDCPCHQLLLPLVTNLTVAWIPIIKSFFLKRNGAYRNTSEEYVLVWGMQLSGSWSHWKPVVSELVPNQEKEWLCAWGKHSHCTIIYALCLREALFCYPKFDGKDTMSVVFYSWKSLLILLERRAIKTTSTVAAAMELYQVKAFGIQIYPYGTVLLMWLLISHTFHSSTPCNLYKDLLFALHATFSIKPLWMLEDAQQFR